MQMFQSASGHSNTQSIANHSSRPTAMQLKCVSDTTSNWFENHQPQKTKISTVTNTPQIQWPPVLTATTGFPSVLFQLPQYSRQRPSFSAHRAALMTKTVSIFPACSSTFVDFAVQFCIHCKFSFHEKRRSSQVWQGHHFLGPITILLLHITTNEIHLYRQ